VLYFLLTLRSHSFQSHIRPRRHTKDRSHRTQAEANQQHISVASAFWYVCGHIPGEVSSTSPEPDHLHDANTGSPEEVCGGSLVAIRQPVQTAKGASGHVTSKLLAVACRQLPARVGRITRR